MRPCCVDASVAIKWYLPEARSDAALHLLGLADAGEVRLIAPELAAYELLSALRRRVDSADLALPAARRIVSEFLGAVELVSAAEFASEALDLSVQHRIWTYDASYLAVASMHRCELWTDDTELASLGNMLPWVHHLGEIERPSRRRGRPRE